MKEAVIEFKNFTFQYNSQKEPTLRDIDLTIRKGEKVLIAGPSGCGKSTIVNCINGLIPFTYKGEITGSLLINGKESRQQSIVELSMTVGTVLQDSDAQFIGTTVREDIAFALENECVGKPEMEVTVRRVAEMVGVGDHLRYAPGELSGGQKQRVSIAGIMVDQVDVLLFDEPLANLDPATGKTAMELIDEVQRQTGAAVIIVEHRLEDVLHRDVDRVVLMGEGRILFDGPADDLLSGELLRRGGIREPLYVTALKYAGVTVTPEMKPHNISTLTLSGEQVEAVRRWYEASARKKEPGERTPFLELKDVSFAYKDRPLTLKGVSTAIYQGELVALVGRNGAGKSTLSKVICGFEKPGGGRLLLKGQDMGELSIKERADHIGYVMQNPNKMISQTMIYDEVALGLRMRKVDEETVREKVEEVLRVCGLYEFRKWPISALSYGQKKRVTIASILALDPEMLILDEPTAGQDFAHYTEIMEFLLGLNRRGLTILMITHDMHLMLEYTDRSIVFCDGQIIAEDTGAGVLTNDEIVTRASLKGTSLHQLSLMCGIEDASSFVQCFIDYDKEVRSHA